MTLGATLADYRPADEAEARDLATIREFLARHPDDPFHRGIVEGHLTGAAIVVETSGRRVLLLHHRKLQRWLQPGGHGDPGERTGEEVALREAREETGLRGLTLHPGAPRPLDVDVHAIPARGSEPAHLHLDLRYLVIAPEGAPTTVQEEEASALRWFGWDELGGLGLDHGLTRALLKARAYFS